MGLLSGPVCKLCKDITLMLSAALWRGRIAKSFGQLAWQLSTLRLVKTSSKKK